MGNGGSKADISVVIPALNEEGNIGAAVRSAKTSRTREIIVVDGGSTDSTAKIARRGGASVVRSPRGRARQLNAGAARATGNILLFLHADSKLPEGWENNVESAITAPPPPTSDATHNTPPRQWGCFETISIDASPCTAWFVRQGVFLRTRFFHRPYGDQGLFMTKSAFTRSGGYPDWPLLEDLALVKQLHRQHGPPAIIPQHMETSGRRWRSLGLIQTTAINQCILIGHAWGIDVHKLAPLYEKAMTTGGEK